MKVWFTWDVKPAGKMYVKFEGMELMEAAIIWPFLRLRK